MPELRLELNSIGDAVCRPAYVELLVAFIDAHADELCEECLERRNSNPLRVLDCKNRDCQAVLAAAPRITDHLCDDCAEHFDEVRGVPGRTRRRLRADAVAGARARLLHPHSLGVDGRRAGAASISGGGRYDGLAEQLGGPRHARGRLRGGAGAAARVVRPQAAEGAAAWCCSRSSPRAPGRGCSR